MPEFLYQFIGLTNAMRDELSPCLPLPETPSQVSMETTPDGTSHVNQQQPKNTENENLIHTICDAISNLQSETNMLRQEVINIKQTSTYAAVLSRDQIPTQQTDGQNRYSSSNIVTP